MLRPVSNFRVGAVFLGIGIALISGATGCAKHQPMAQFTVADAGARTTVIQKVAVFDGSATAPSEPRDVWIVGDRIDAVVMPGARPATAADSLVDGSGATLLPGLIDTHVHVAGNISPPWKLELPKPRRSLEQFVLAGLTTVIDTGGDPEQLGTFRNEIRQGEQAGPDLRYAGHPISVPGGHPEAMVRTLLPWPLSALAARRISVGAATPEEAASKVRDAAEAGATIAKIAIDQIPLGIPEMDLPRAKAAVEQAHALGLTAVAHIGSNANAMLAVTAGVDLLIHNVYREEISGSTIAALLAAQIPVIPTIGVFHQVDRLTHEGIASWPLHRQLIDPEMAATLTRPVDYEGPEAFSEWLEVLHAHRETRFRNAKALYDAGVTILVGSDSANLAWIPGAAMHREMQHLVQAGIPAGVVLKQATAGNAKAFGLHDRGRIVPGLRADLLLVDGDPTQTIASTQNIRHVWAAGRPVKRVAQE